MPYQDGLRHEFSSLDPLAALRAPTDALLGVDATAKAALSSLGLDTVFDLATAPLFQLASDIAAAAQGRDSSGLSRFDRVPGGVAAADSPVSLADFRKCRYRVTAQSDRCGRVSLSPTDPIVQDVHQLDLQMVESS